MEIKVGDLIQNRYVIKKIMLDPSKNLKEPIFILFDKEKDIYVNYNKEEMMKLLNIKEAQ